jgi:hypothetical protein
MFGSMTQERIADVTWAVQALGRRREEARVKALPKERRKGIVEQAAARWSRQKRKG